MKFLHPFKIQFTIFVLLIFTINSCKKDSTDFSKFDNYSPTPEFSIPLFNTNINLQNITLNDSFNSSIDNNGLLHFVYRQDSLFTYKITDFYNFENINKTSINTSLGEITINNASSSKKSTLQDLTANFSATTKTVFDTIAGKNAIFPSITESITVVKPLDAFNEFTSVSFSQGYLILTIRNHLPINLSAITLNLYNLLPTQTLLGVYNYTNIAPGASKSDSILLTNKTLSNSLGYSMPVFNTNSSAPTAVLVNYQDSIVITAKTIGVKASSGTAIFPNQSITNQSTTLDFSTADSTQRIRKLKLAGGKLNIIAQSTIKEPIELTINFTGALKNGMPFPSQVITIPTTGSSTFYYDSTINLAGVSLDLTQKASKPYNNVSITYSVRVLSSGLPVTFNANDYINLQVNTTNNLLEYIEGYFGREEVQANKKDFINLSFLDNFNGGFNLNEPELKITVNNSAGVPIEFQFNVIGKNKDGKIQDAQIVPFTANFPLVSEAGQTKNTFQVYSNKNGNGKINELLSLPPNSVQITGKMLSNPINDPTINQFVKLGSALNVNLELDLPLALSTSSFSLNDSTSFDALQFDKFKEVTLGLNIDNRFPFDANIKIVFMNDSNNIPIDSVVYNKIVTSAITDANGKTIQSSKSKTRISLDENRLQKLIANRANKIKTFTTFITENNGTKPIKIYSDYDMKINVGIIATIKKL
jgi:hypothetical protein